MFNEKLDPQLPEDEEKDTSNFGGTSDSHRNDDLRTSITEPL